MIPVKSRLMERLRNDDYRWGATAGTSTAESPPPNVAIPLEIGI
jgi:hypothetical protein